jgi:iron complex transport system permease protein
MNRAGNTVTRRTLRPVLCCAAASAACAVSVFLACYAGAFPVEFADVTAVLLHAAGLGPPPAAAQDNPALTVVVLELRLGRVVLSLLVGASLAVAGTVYQGLLRNPLADPFTLGVSSGAAFGASVALFWGLGTMALPFFPAAGILPAAALTGATAALAAVLVLGRVGGIMRRETLVLAGIVVSTFLSALISLVKSLDEESVASIVFWIMGSLQGRGWHEVMLFTPWFVLGMLPVIRFSRELDILSLGDVQARQLGMDASRVRLWLLLGAGALTGVSVAVSGVIGFVGLVVPHLVRMVIGAEHRPLLAVSALTGGLLLLWSDVLARTLLSGGAELPVGVVTALLGGPFFCLLLRRNTGTAL